MPVLVIRPEGEKQPLIVDFDPTKELQHDVEKRYGVSFSEYYESRADANYVLTLFDRTSINGLPVARITLKFTLSPEFVCNLRLELVDIAENYLPPHWASPVMLMSAQDACTPRLPLENRQRLVCWRSLR